MKSTESSISNSTQLQNEKKLIITKSKNVKLTKAQDQFNKYTKRIDKLRKEIESSRLKLEFLLKHYNARVLPVEKEYAHKTVDLCKVLYTYYTTENVSRNTKIKLREFINNNLEIAFEYVKPTDELTQIFDATSEISLKELHENELQMMKDEMQFMFKNRYNIDVDFSDIDSFNSEKMARKIAELKERIKNIEEKNNGRNNFKKKVASNKKKEEEENIKMKNIRNIYTSLAKILHPDTEINHEKKLEKEELMKKVTTAYQAKDLFTLLKMEIEIIHSESENLQQLTDEKLSILNAVLKEQFEQLQQERYILETSPRYEPCILHYYLPEKKAIMEMNNNASETEDFIYELNKDIEKLSTLNGKKYLNAFLKKRRETDFNMNDLFMEAFY